MHSRLFRSSVRFFAAVALCAGLLSSARATSFITASATLPASGTAAWTEGTYSGANGTGSITGQTTLGVFDFSSTFATLPQLDAITITITLINFDTEVGSTDFNNITLVLNGIDTGIYLNGFTNSIPGDNNAEDTQTITGLLASTAGAAIMNSLNTSGGLLTATLSDATTSPKNRFFFDGGVATLTLTQVPFSPSQTVGLAVLGLLAGAKFYRRRAATRA